MCSIEVFRTDAGQSGIQWKYICIFIYMPMTWLGSDEGHLHTHWVASVELRSWSICEAPNIIGFSLLRTDILYLLHWWDIPALVGYVFFGLGYSSNLGLSGQSQPLWNESVAYDSQLVSYQLINHWFLGHAFSISVRASLRSINTRAFATSIHLTMLLAQTKQGLMQVWCCFLIWGGWFPTNMPST